MWCFVIRWCFGVPPAPMNHVKIFKGWPPRDAPSKLAQLWYKSFLPDQSGLVEMKIPTRLSNKTSNASSCAEDQILENKNLRNMILNICTGREVKYFREIYSPVREHTWLIGSGGQCHQSWRFIGRHFQLYDTYPMIPNWPWAWPCWNCTGSYKFSVSVKKMGEGWTGGASDILKAGSSGEDPRAIGGLVFNLPHPRVNKTKQHIKQSNTHTCLGLIKQSNTHPHT